MTAPAATVRPATAADVAAIVALELIAFPADPWSENLVTEGVEALLPTVTFLVAERDGAFAGHAVVSVVHEDAELQRIAVTEPLRRTGLATALLAGVIDLAAARGATRLLLEVREDNHAARAFYERAGFAELAHRPRYYRDGTTAVVLALPLTGGL